MTTPIRTLKPFGFHGVELGNMYRLIETEKMLVKRKKEEALKLEKDKKLKKTKQYSIDDLVDAIHKNDDLKIVSILNSGINLNKIAKNGKLPLVQAIENGNYTLATVLESKGASPLKMDRAGRTAMGLVWVDSAGGFSKYPIENASVRKGSRLLRRWQNIYGYRKSYELFSKQFQQQNLNHRLQSELDISTRFLDVNRPIQITYGQRDWDTVLNPTEALERRRIKKVIETPEINRRPKMNMGRIF